MENWFFQVASETVVVQRRWARSSARVARLAMRQSESYQTYCRVRPSTRLITASLKLDVFRNHRRLVLQHC